MYKAIPSVLLLGILFPGIGCRTGASSGNSTSGFANPRLVTIGNYSDSAMEPFISRDGKYLFFNNAGGTTDKDLYIAERIDDCTFGSTRALSEINSTAVDGAPSQDSDNNLYYVSLKSYTPTTSNNTLYTASWSGSTVSGESAIATLYIDTALVLYFDIEVSSDGTTAYLSKGDFNGGSPPKTADIVIAVHNGSNFTYDAAEDYILANINTSDMLEYAPALSRDELELFFTRMDPVALTARIYRASRDDTTSAFSKPEIVEAIDGFVEGPALSPDEKKLYYHKLNTDTQKYELYCATRD